MLILVTSFTWVLLGLDKSVLIEHVLDTDDEQVSLRAAIVVRSFSVMSEAGGGYLFRQG